MSNSSSKITAAGMKSRPTFGSDSVRRGEKFGSIGERAQDSVFLAPSPSVSPADVPSLLRTLPSLRPSPPLLTDMLSVLTLRPHALARPAAARLGSVYSLPSSLPFTLAARPLLNRRFLATQTQKDNLGSTETLGQVDRKDRVDDVDVRKYKAAAADVRGETFILVDEPLEKKGTTAEGRHFKGPFSTSVESQTASYQKS